MRISSAILATLFSASLSASAQTPPSYTPPPSCKATLAAPVVAGPKLAPYFADRNNAMATANLAFNCRDYEAAYQLYLKVLDSYPKDTDVLRYAAFSASSAGNYDAAIALNKRIIQAEPRFTYPARGDLMHIYIRLGRWDDFQSARLEARAADHAGTLTNSRDQPFTIEYLMEGLGPVGTVGVVEFPALYGPNHTLDRFQLREELDMCTSFAPYIDLAATDPAAGASTTYSLLAFPTATTRWLIKTYPPGEPPYQTVRADVLSALDKPLTSIKPPAFCSTPTPSATNGGLSTSAGH